MFLSGSWDHSIKIWHLPTGKLQQTLAGDAAHKGRVNGIAVHPNDKTFVSASADNTIKIWRLP
ncbi:MAG: hypothetical protein CUN55_20680 [Phototrophicales bacterium]|nr:MAG: hypothetical protein CUN55_20680 [Phototrophicales bacterium]